MKQQEIDSRCSRMNVSLMGTPMALDKAMAHA
jgi:hypothetical protein